VPQMKEGMPYEPDTYRNPLDITSTDKVLAFHLIIIFPFYFIQIIVFLYFILLIKFNAYFLLFYHSRFTSYLAAPTSYSTEARLILHCLISWSRATKKMMTVVLKQNQKKKGKRIIMAS
jgi:hypothetical protein